MSGKGLTGWIDAQAWLQKPACKLQALVGDAFEAGGENGQKVKNFLHGLWLGHPVHPAITDVPVGAFTVTALLDAAEACGNRAAAGTADAALGIGVIAATASAFSGLADFQASGEQAPRLGLAHGTLSCVATAIYAWSWVLRRRDERAAARNWALLGYATLSLAAYLGGEMVSNKTIGVDHATRDYLPLEFVPILPEAELKEGQLKRAYAGEIKVLLARKDGHIYALGELCSHLAGPLSEGELIDCTVRCPWHGSRFELATGKVVDGPATFPQPRFETRVKDGQIEVRVARD